MYGRIHTYIAYVVCRKLFLLCLYIESTSYTLTAQLLCLHQPVLWHQSVNCYFYLSTVCTSTYIISFQCLISDLWHSAPIILTSKVFPLAQCLYHSHIQSLPSATSFKLSPDVPRSLPVISILLCLFCAVEASLPCRSEH